jgi:hypothetical protein
MPGLHRREEVYVLDLGDDENRFTLDWLTSVNTLLDEVGSQPAPRAWSRWREAGSTPTGSIWTGS